MDTQNNTNKLLRITRAENQARCKMHHRLGASPWQACLRIGSPGRNPCSMWVSAHTLSTPTRYYSDFGNYSISLSVLQHFQLHIYYKRGSQVHLRPAHRHQGAFWTLRTHHLPIHRYQCQRFPERKLTNMTNQTQLKRWMLTKTPMTRQT